MMKGSPHASTPGIYLLSYELQYHEYCEDFRTAVEKASATRRLMRLGLALFRHQLEHGEFPEDPLPEFALLPDPFTGEAFRYRRTAEGFILYSVGPNLLDEGGETSKRPGSGPDDVSWIHPTPPDP
jgi:hypothetical protein